MRYLHLKDEQVMGYYAGPQPGIKLEANEKIIQVEDDDPRIIKYNNKEIS